MADTITRRPRRLGLPGIALGSAGIAAAITVAVLALTREDRGLPAPQANLMASVAVGVPRCVRLVVALNLADAAAEARLFARCFVGHGECAEARLQWGRAGMSDASFGQTFPSCQ